MSNEVQDIEAPEHPNGPELAQADLDAKAEAADTPPGVLVIKHKDEQGNINVEAVPVGGVEPTEVLTLLEMGLAAFRARVGLPGR